MDEKKRPYRIKVTRNGPFLVTGNVPLDEKVIVPDGRTQVRFEDGRALPQAETYALCRCGRSKNPPFCDGSHERHGFIGREVASQAPFIERSTRLKGKTLDILDDGRCAYARFCHSDRGRLSELIKSSDDPENRSAALKAIVECPAGRLVAVDEDGTVIEPELEPGISVLQDPRLGVGGPLYVHGGIPIESADGEVYEVRNRITLCRCGQSEIMPFCDAKHVSIRFKDPTGQGKTP